MLVLARKQDEKIRLGSDIVISVVSIGDNQVKIGIDAPREVKILREELYENVKRNVVEASQSADAKTSEELKRLRINKR
ncbi:MAG: carbon storage regulator CsrA [Ignavibacteriales bacterium]|jgi:carbon storage regulator|nr:carbon storage regulator CsrA [Ignavibacteriales bacterium]